MPAGSFCPVCSEGPWGLPSMGSFPGGDLSPGVKPVCLETGAQTPEGGPSHGWVFRKNPFSVDPPGQQRTSKHPLPLNFLKRNRSTCALIPTIPQERPAYHEAGAPFCLLVLQMRLSKYIGSPTPTLPSHQVLLELSSVIQLSKFSSKKNQLDKFAFSEQ